MSLITRDTVGINTESVRPPFFYTTAREETQYLALPGYFMMASASITQMRNPRKRLCPFASVQSSKKIRTEYSSSLDSHVSMFSMMPDEIVVEVRFGFWFLWRSALFCSLGIFFLHKEHNTEPIDTFDLNNSVDRIDHWPIVCFQSRFYASFHALAICNQCQVFVDNSPSYMMNPHSGEACVMSNFHGSARNKPKSPTKKIGSHILFAYIACLSLLTTERDFAMHSQHSESWASLPRCKFRQYKPRSF